MSGRRMDEIKNTTGAEEHLAGAEAPEIWGLALESAAVKT
jgi:hypothetical protein